MSLSDAHPPLLAEQQQESGQQSSSAQLDAGSPPAAPSPAPDALAAFDTSALTAAGKPLLIALVGMPGAGKSSLSAQIRARVPRGAVRVVCQDECGTRQLCAAAASNALENGRSVLIDRCNVDAKQRAEWVALGRQYGCAVACVFLDLSADECMQRVMKRKGHKTLPPSKMAPVIMQQFATRLRAPEPSEGSDTVLVATTAEAAEALVEPIASAIERAMPGGNAATPLADEAEVEVVDAMELQEEEEERDVDLTLAERRKLKAANAKARRGRRDAKLKEAVCCE